MSDEIAAAIIEGDWAAFRAWLPKLLETTCNHGQGALVKRGELIGIFPDFEVACWYATMHNLGPKESWTFCRIEPEPA